jgi:chemotaxis protein MotA
MFVIIGLVIVLGSIILGYTMHGGQIGVLMQVTEFIIIGGSAFGSVLIGNPFSVVKQTLQATMGLMKGNPYKQEVYIELLQMLYDFFMLARREGLVALDQHVENPHESSFFSQYPFLAHHHHALDFLADTMRVVITGSTSSYDLADMMDIDLQASHEECRKPTEVMQKLGDSMPGFGIVAAVLGVVITMGAIGGDPKEIGHSVAAALVGTFLGVLLAYGVFNPISTAMEAQVKCEASYMNCIKCALLSFSRGDAPLTAAEFARRNIEPVVRPTFMDMEAKLKKTGGEKTAQAA